MAEVLQEAFEKYGKRKRFQRNELLISQEDAPDKVFFLLKGDVEVRIAGFPGGELSLTTLSEGEIFGELALLTGKARSATVKARRNGEAVFLNRDEFFLLLEKEPAVVREILKRLACRIVRLTEQVKILGVKPGRGCKRIATALLLFEDFPEYCPSGLTKAYLSRFCGLSWQQTNRILKAFKEKGWVDLPSDGHEIVVQNLEGLRKFIAEER